LKEQAKRQTIQQDHKAKTKKCKTHQDEESQQWLGEVGNYQESGTYPAGWGN